MGKHVDVSAEMLVMLSTSILLYGEFGGLF
jgi:hypothetical protein